MPRTSDRKSLFWSKWFWIPLVLAGAFVASANAATYLIQFPAVDCAPLPGVLRHLGDAGVFSRDEDGSPLRAQRHVGSVASQHRDRQAAIDAFKKVVDVPDTLPKRPKQGAWDTDWEQLTKHRACVELSDLYLELDDPASAIKFAELALDKFRFSSPCGTANWSEEYALRERIDAIKSALAGGKPIVIEPRSTALARFNSARRGPPPQHPVGRVK